MSAYNGGGDSSSEMDAGNAGPRTSNFYFRVEEEGRRDHARAMDALHRLDTRKRVAKMISKPTPRTDIAICTRVGRKAC